MDIELKYKQIESELKDGIKTIFDSDEFDFSIDLSNAGHAIRDDLARSYNLYGRLNTLAAKANFMYKQQELKRDKVGALAWKAIYAKSEKLKVAVQKGLMLIEEIEFNGGKTTLIQEEEQLLLYEYLADRAQDKRKEIVALLDLGRSILSWDRTELEKMMG